MPIVAPISMSFSTPRFCWYILALVLVSMAACDQSGEVEEQEIFYPGSKPGVRWWWFATEIKKPDIKYQLDWAKSQNFGGVEVAWVYPLHRYQRMYARRYGRNYPVDSSAQEWLSPEWIDVVTYTKRYADSIGMSCDFTFGSAWPVAGDNIGTEHTTKIYGDTSFRQLLTFAWSWPDTLLVIDHLDSNAFNKFAEPIGTALKAPLQGSKSALFTDSWEIKLNFTNKIWTDGFEDTFEQEFGYDIIPFMERGLDSFPHVRYDYMLHLHDYVVNGFYKPYVAECKELGAWSRVQCLASPTDVMTTYALVDIPETEAMLNNPNYSRIVSSAASLSAKPLVSCESFTCMYGFPGTYLREEQTADLKLIADALFAQGVNHHIYHGMPYNPMGADTIDFFATTYFGPGGSLTPELKEFNRYIETVSGMMRRGKTYSEIAVYIPYEDAVMNGAYPPERRRVWVWGEYEMRYIDAPQELKGYHPLWINRHFLESAEFRDKNLQIGDANFTTLYVDVDYMDIRSLRRIGELATAGLPVVWKRDPLQPGKIQDGTFDALITDLKSLPNVSADLSEVVGHPPLISGDSIPDYWCRVEEDGTHYIFLAQWGARDLAYPLYSGQSFMHSASDAELTFHVSGKTISKGIHFEPYQSLLYRITPSGEIHEVDIDFVPEDPWVRPKEKQKMYF